MRVGLAAARAAPVASTSARSVRLENEACMLVPPCVVCTVAAVHSSDCTYGVSYLCRDFQTATEVTAQAPTRQPWLKKGAEGKH